MNNKLSNEDIKLFGKLIEDTKYKHPHITSPSEVMLMDRVFCELLVYKEAYKTAIARLDVQHSHPKPRALSWLRGGIELPDGLYFVYASPVLGQTPALRDVITERQRQITVEGYTPKHDDEHTAGELASAGASYALSGSGWSNLMFRQTWPWERSWWKSTTPRGDLVKAAALILAEIERLDRAMGENK